MLSHFNIELSTWLFLIYCISLTEYFSALNGWVISIYSLRGWNDDSLIEMVLKGCAHFSYRLSILIVSPKALVQLSSDFFFNLIFYESNCFADKDYLKHVAHYGWLGHIYDGPGSLTSLSMVRRSIFNFVGFLFCKCSVFYCELPYKLLWWWCWCLG